MGCGMKCCSIKNEGARVQGEVATGGWGPARRGLKRRRADEASSSIHGEFSGSGGWDKEKSYEEIRTVWKKGRTGGSTEEEYEHVLPISLAQRPCSLPPLLPYFG